MPGQNIQYYTKSIQNNLHSCGIQEQSEAQNKQHYITQGNSPKIYGSHLGTKTHIQHTHSQHLSTRTQTYITNKSTHRNNMGQPEGDTHVTYNVGMRSAMEYASSIWSPLASQPVFINYKSCRMQHSGLPQDAHKTQHLHDKTLTLPIHKDLQLHASQHPSHPLHKHTTYFTTSSQKHYLYQCPLHKKHSHRPPHQSLLSLGTRGNNKILHTPPPHSSYKDILPRLTLAQLRTNKFPFSNHTYTKSTSTHIHHHYASSVTPTHHLFNCTHIRTMLSPM